MRDLAIAQLGSNSLNQKAFRKKFSFAIITKMLPAMFRDLGEEKWEKEIKSLEGAKSLKKAIKAAYDVADANDVASAAYDAAASAARHAAYPDYVNYSVYYVAKATNTGDKYLKMVAHLAVEVLKDMKSPGCQFI